MVMLRWWLIFCLSLASLLFCHSLGLLEGLHRVDASYLGFVCIVLFFGASVWAGWTTWTVRQTMAYDLLYKKTKSHISSLWLVQATLLDLGMVGTLIGFMLMLTGGAGIAGFNLESVTDTQRALGTMAVAMSTAVVTTLVGLITSTVLKFQLVNLESLLSQPDAE